MPYTAEQCGFLGKALASQLAGAYGMNPGTMQLVTLEDRVGWVPGMGDLINNYLVLHTTVKLMPGHRPGIHGTWAHRSFHDFVRFFW